ncbi:MAG: hypothetical protein WD468_06445, partial [Pirellulales bacterium]
MNRQLLYSMAVYSLALLASASTALAQGVLVDVRIDHPIRLPRPIPRPPHVVPQPPSSYKIDAIEVNAKLDDQVAQ